MFFICLRYLFKNIDHTAGGDFRERVGLFPRYFRAPLQSTDTDYTCVCARRLVNVYTSVIALARALSLAELRSKSHWQLTYLVVRVDQTWAAAFLAKLANVFRIQKILNDKSESNTPIRLLSKYIHRFYRIMFVLSRGINTYHTVYLVISKLKISPNKLLKMFAVEGSLY